MYYETFHSILSGLPQLGFFIIIAGGVGTSQIKGWWGDKKGYFFRKLEGVVNILRIFEKVGVLVIQCLAISQGVGWGVMCEGFTDFMCEQENSGECSKFLVICKFSFKYEIFTEYLCDLNSKKTNTIPFAKKFADPFGRRIDEHGRKGKEGEREEEEWRRMEEEELYIDSSSEGLQ